MTDKKPTETKDKKLSEEQEKEQLQQKYMQFQMLQQQIEQASQQVEILNQQLKEVNTSVKAIKELEKTTTDSEVLASIAPGIFIKTKLKDNQKLLVNVGAKVTTEKNRPEVVKLLEEQKENLEKQVTQADALLQMMSQQAMALYQEFEKLQ